MRWHPPAHNPGWGGLGAGAAVGNDGNPVRAGQILADDQMAVHIQNVGIGQPQANAPNGQLVFDAMKLADKGHGVLLLTLNYAGDQLAGKQAEDIIGTRTPPPSPCWPAPISIRSVSPRSPKDMPFWGWVASVDLTVRLCGQGHAGRPGGGRHLRRPQRTSSFS